MDPPELLEKLFDEKKLRILKFFFNRSEEEFYLREITKETKLPVATVFRLVKKLKDLEVIKMTQLKKFKTYSYNKTKNNEFLQDIIAQKKSALNEFVDQASTVDEIEQIILHGKEDNNKANVLLIGHNMPIERIKNIVVDIKERFKFSIIDLNLEHDQFLKMSEMGLFPGKRTTLFQK